MDPRQDILDTLDAYADAYCAKDVARLMDIFVAGEDISLIGTGADELCSGRAAIAGVFERNFIEASATRFEWHWQDVAIHGNAATVATTFNIHISLGDRKLVIPLRWTVSLIKTDDGWKWVHRHASSAAGSQKEGAAYPIGTT